jgi:hypothetical protein
MDWKGCIKLIQFQDQGGDVMKKLFVVVLSVILAVALSGLLVSCEKKEAPPGEVTGEKAPGEVTGEKAPGEVAPPAGAPGYKAPGYAAPGYKVPKPPEGEAPPEGK